MAVNEIIENAQIFAPEETTELTIGGMTFMGSYEGSTRPAAISTDTAIYDTSGNHDPISISGAKVGIKGATISGGSIGLNITSSPHVLVEGSTISGNIGSDSAVYDSGSLTEIIGSVIIGNTSANTQAGGGYYNISGSATIIDSLLDRNVTKNFGGAVRSNAGTLTITGSTVSNNSAERTGAVHVSGGDLAVSNTLFVSNRNTVNNSDSKGGVITVSSAGSHTISGSTFRNNYATRYGAIYIDKGTLSISGTTFSGNSAGQTGVVHATGGAFNISSVVFDGNRNTVNNSDARGGVITLIATGTYTITGSTFSGNYSTRMGGAIYLTTGTLEIGNSKFAGNSAGTNGGAIYQDGGSLTVTNSFFTENSATYGGAIQLSGGMAEISGSTFVGNISGGYGTAFSVSAGSLTVTDSLVRDTNSNGPFGPVYVTGGSMTLSGSTISGSTAQRVGVMYVTNGDVSVSGTLFDNNRNTKTNADAYSGAINLNGTGTITISGSTFSRSYSGLYGGAVNLTAGTLSISGTTFAGNTASSGGGAIYQTGGLLTVANSVFGGNSVSSGSGGGLLLVGGTAAISGSTFLENTVTNGGAAFAVTAGSLAVTDSLVNGNAGDTAFGPVYVTGGSVTLSGSTISDNTYQRVGGMYVTAGDVSVNNTLFDNNRNTKTNADAYAGAILLNGTGPRTISGSTFSRNYSGLYSGAINFAGTSLSISGTTFAGNTAKSGGGAIYQTSGLLTIANSVFGRNSVSSGSGGGLLLTGGTTAISGSTFCENTVSSGGAAFAVTAGVLTLTDSLVNGNATSDTPFGPVYVTGGSVTLSGSTISDNTYQRVGGMYVTGGDISVSNTLFDNNRNTKTNADAYAGAINFSGTGVLSISGSTFSGNYSGQYGSAIKFEGVSLSISGTTFSGNSARLGGGAIHQTSGTMTVANSIFSGNSVSDNYGKGGGFLLTDGTAAISGSTFSGNTCYQGSAFAVAAGFLTVTDSLIADSTNAFGPIHVTGGTVVLSGSTIGGNTSNRVGAMNVNGGTLSVGDTLFDGNRSTLLNTDSVSGCVYINGSGDYSISGSTFSNNYASMNSGALAFAGISELRISNTIFAGNTARLTGGAINQLSGTLSISGTTFSGNAAGTDGGAIIIAAGATITVANSLFVTSSDTVANGGGLTFSGVNRINAGVSGSGTTAVAANSTLIFGNTAAIDVAGLTFAGSNGVTFNGTGTVNFADQSLADVTITVSSAVLPAEGANFTIATGITSLTDAVITIDGTTPVNLNGTTEFGGGTYTFTYEDNSLAVSQVLVKYGEVAAAPDGTTSVIIGGTVVTLDHRYDTVEAALTHLDPGGKLIVAGLTFGSGNYYFSGNDEVILAGGASVASTNLYFTQGDEVVTGDLNVTVDHSTIPNSYAIYGGTEVSGKINVTLDGATVTDRFSACATDVAKTFCSGVNYTVTDSLIVNGLYGGGSISDPTIGGDVNIILTGSTVGGEKGVTGSRANKVTGTISITMAGSTVSAVNKHDSGKTNVTAPMTLTISGATNSVIGGTMSDVDDLVIDAGASVTFDTAQSLSGVALTVDGSAYVSGDVTVASGVTGFGGYTLTGTDNAALFLKLDGTDLVMYERAADLADGQTETNFVGGTANLITGGTVTAAFFGTRKNSFGSVRTVFTGGTVVNSMVAGALVQAKDTANAALDTVSVDIYDGVSLLGGTANGGMNYVAGYAYGRTEWTELPGSANYTVGEAVLNLSGSSISGNLYAGAHARKYAYTSVAATTVNVTGGIVEKLYGGGWAERGDKNITGGTAALSTVGTATVNISGGSINRLYAGGGNSLYGYTSVDTANLTISGGTVDFVFLGGRNINCFVGDTTLTITGDAQTLTRISGLNDCGVDNTTGTAALNVQTNVMLGYLDYVDRINIAEACTLNITELVLYDDISQELSVYLGTDGFDGTWDIFSATNARDIDTLAEAQFFVNNTACAMGGSVDIGGDSYRLDKSGLGIALSKIG